MTTHPLVGVHHNINIDAYHSSAGISKSGLDKINQSPYHYWSHYLDPQRPPEEPRTSASEMAGTLLHAALLEPDEFAKRYAVGPDVSRATKEWKAFAEANKGRACIKPDQHTDAWRQADAIRALPEIRDALRKGRAEVSAYWTAP
jgi:exodeoxyribonuclease VIII